MKLFFFTWTLAALLILSFAHPLFGQEAREFNLLASHLTESSFDDLPVLLKKRYIRVLTTFNKTNFFLSKGELYGYEYALLKEYEKFLNKGIKKRDLRVVLEFIPVSRDRLIPGLLPIYGGATLTASTCVRDSTLTTVAP